MNDIEEIWKILAEKQNIIFQTQSNSVIFKSQEKQMLTEDRYKKIVEFLEREGAGSVKKLSEVVGTSESTIRRDLAALDQECLITKVYGGATSKEHRIRTEETDMLQKHNLYSAEKERIGKYAARLVEENDFVYIDGGTTTEAVIRYLTEKKATYVTNGLFQAQLLIGRGFQTYVLGGRIRPETEAIVGAESLEQIESYNFSIGFFGTNGITLENGFTTPDLIEGSVKEAAMRKSLRAVVLADPSKFGRIYPMTFGEIQDAEIITTVLPEPSLKNKTKITEADYDLHGDV